MSQDSFPMVILHSGSESPAFIKNSEDLPVGSPFRILLTEATSVQFQITQQVCERLLKK